MAEAPEDLSPYIYSAEYGPLYVNIKRPNPRGRGLGIPCYDPNETYVFKHPYLGHAIIVNNAHSTREGSRVDVEALQKTFKEIGFEVMENHNFNAHDMSLLKQWIADPKNHEDKNMLLVTVICHGNTRGELLDKDGALAWTIEGLIRDLSNVTSLQGKPKVLVLQCCRTNSSADWSLGGDSWISSTSTISEDPGECEKLAGIYANHVTNAINDCPDMFVAFATTPGQKAEAGDEYGSRYLQSFAAFLERHYLETDLDTILTMVNRFLGESDPGPFQEKQTSEKRSSLRYKLHFQLEEEDTFPESPPENEMPDPPQEVRERPLPEPPQRSVSNEAPQEVPRKHMRTPSDPGSGYQNQPRRLLNLTLICTHETGLKLSPLRGNESVKKPGQVAVMPNSGEVVIWGKRKKLIGADDAAAFHVFHKTDTTWKERRVLAPLCDKNHVKEHEHSQYLLSGKGDNFTDCVAISCTRCQTIRTFDMQSQKVASVVHLEGRFPGAMVPGNPSTMYVVKKHNGVEVMEMDSTGSRLTGNTITPKITPFNAICYVPVPVPAVVFSSAAQSYLQALAVEDGRFRWQVPREVASPEVDGAKCDPRGMAFSSRHQALLLADGRNSRILALNPATGSHVDTIQFNKAKIGTALEIFLRYSRRRSGPRDYKLILVHQPPKQSCVSISYFQLHDVAAPPLYDVPLDV